MGLRILTAAAAIAVSIGSASAQQITPQQTERNLKTFDELDFDVWSNQKWDRASESHAENVKVYWPDGRVTTGLHDHIEDMRFIFTFAPDAKISSHPIRIGDGAWTAVTGEMKGTFTQPMHLPNGKVLPPTGKAFAISLVTIGHWDDSGRMDQEWLYWDNHHFFQQLGIAE
jgi:hypothetical protein